MDFYLQVIGTNHCSNVPPSVLLVSETSRVLFNAGDGTKRLCEEHGLKLNKMTDFFVCSLDWDCCLGGLVDLVYYLATSRKDINIHGPKGLIDYFHTTRYFLYVKNFFIHLREILNEKYTVKIGGDRNKFEILPVIIQSSQQHLVKTDRGDIINPLFVDLMNIKKEFIKNVEAIEEIENILKKAEIPLNENRPVESDSIVKKLDITLDYNRQKRFYIPEKNLSSICYVIHSPDIMPKFNQEKALELGIPKGPLFGKLIKGENVTTKDGRIVRPEDCLIGSKTPGPVSIIIYCPSEDYTSMLFLHPKWNKYYFGSKFHVACIFHMTPGYIINSEKYINWMKKFPSDTTHIFLNKEMSNSEHVFIRSEMFIRGLNYINPEFFSFSKPSPPTETFSEKNGIKYYIADFLTKFNLQPLKNLGIDNSSIFKRTYIDPTEYLNSVPQFLQNLEIYHKNLALSSNIKNLPILENISRDEVELVLLGTGSADPSLNRNVSGMLLNMFKNGSILIDCGSGTFHQLYRKYGEYYEDILINIKCVWISHKHSDHHNGLVPVLKHRQQCLKKRGIIPPPLIIIGPKMFIGYLQEISYVSTTLEFQFYHHSILFQENHNLSKFFFNNFGIIEAKSVNVIHGGDSSALILTHKSGWKFVFSGDTRPSQKLVDVGKNCTLLVHEATLCDRDKDLAIKKAHSTTSEALYVAKQMNAYRVVLTHFSQRQNPYAVSDFAFIDEPEDVVNENKYTERDFNDSRFTSDDEIKGFLRVIFL